eukprot:7638585-Pyramimonas_sp.AAC.1
MPYLVCARPVLFQVLPEGVPLLAGGKPDLHVCGPPSNKGSSAVHQLEERRCHLAELLIPVLQWNGDKSSYITNGSSHFIGQQLQLIAPQLQIAYRKCSQFTPPPLEGACCRACWTARPAPEPAGPKANEWSWTGQRRQPIRGGQVNNTNRLSKVSETEIVRVAC